MTDQDRAMEVRKAAFSAVYNGSLGGWNVAQLTKELDERFASALAEAREASQAEITRLRGLLGEAVATTHFFLEFTEEVKNQTRIPPGEVDTYEDAARAFLSRLREEGVEG